MPTQSPDNVYDYQVECVAQTPRPSTTEYPTRSHPYYEQSSQRRQDPQSQRASDLSQDPYSQTPCRIGSSDPLSTPTIRSPPIDPALLGTGSQLSSSGRFSHQIALSSQFTIRGRCYIWERSYGEAFEEWFNEQGARRKESSSDDNTTKNPTWGSKKLSWTWDFYDEGALIESGEARVICLRCDHDLLHPKSGQGTKSLAEHLTRRKCRKEAASRGMAPVNVDSVRKDKTPTYATSRQTELKATDFDRCQTEMIIATGLPLTFFQNSAVQKAFQCFHPDPQFLSASTQKRRIFATQEQAINQIRKALSQGRNVALALDAWSAPFLRESYLAVTGYWIDRDWSYHHELLGFPVIRGRHSGTVLSKLVEDIINTYDIRDRIVSITTDNATNNKTLHQALVEAVQLWKSSEKIQTSIPRLLLSAPDDTQATLVPDDDAVEGLPTHIPCLAHIIQLAIKALYEFLRLAPMNDDIVNSFDIDASREGMDKARQDTRMHGMPALLYKVRQITIHVNGSSQRQESFRSMQSRASVSTRGKGRTLRLLQDVRTRWDSTTHMLQRFRKLRSAVEAYCQTHQLTWLSLHEKEWRQIDYLIALSLPFARCTTEIGKTKGPTLHLVFGIYNYLFDEIEDAQHRLRPKREPWKQDMLRALNATRDKLKKYYSATDEYFGDLYGMAVLLNPALKNIFWKSKAWQGKGSNHSREYWEKLSTLYHNKYVNRTKNRDSDSLSQDTQLRQQSSVRRPAEFRIMSAITGQQSRSGKMQPTPRLDEFKNYKAANFDHFLQEYDDDVLQMWRRIEMQFPTVAQMARDILCIPATGVGVERVFSVARHQARYNRSYSPSVFTAILISRHRLMAPSLDAIYAETMLADQVSGTDAETELKDFYTHSTILDEIGAISENEQDADGLSPNSVNPTILSSPQGSSQGMLTPRRSKRKRPRMQ